MSQENKNVSNENLENLFTEIERLAKLPQLAYELERNAVTDKFKIRLSTLDEAVKKHQVVKENSIGGTIMFRHIEPWPEEVSAANLLYELSRTIKKFVTLGEHETVATALWILFTHCIETASVSPILYIYSPERRCGKSTLLSLVGELVYRPLSAANISAAATFRTIEMYHPCLLLDEVDTFINDKNSELGGIINSGHTRSQAFVMRVVGKDHEPKQFSTWCPKCVCGIGRNMPSPTRDRSIFIKVCRKLKNESIEKIRRANKNEFLNLQRKCMRFAIDNPNIYKTLPVIPEELNDRAADNWEPLLQIATIAGTKWLKYATDAALVISGDEAEQDTKTQGIQLLEAIQGLFDSKFKNYTDITTADLIESLCADVEEPWVTYNQYGRDPKINPYNIANLLRPFGIKSKTLNRGLERPRGYVKSTFNDAFSRYIPAYTSDFSATSATTFTQMAQPCGLQGKNDEKNYLLPIRYDAATSSINIQMNDSSSSDMVADSSGYEKNTADTATSGLYRKSSVSSDKNKERDEIYLD